MPEKMNPTDFLNALELQDLQSNFEENAIDADTLGSLTAEDLEEMEITGDAASSVLWGVSNLTPTHDWLSGLELTNYLGAFAANRVELNQIASLDKDDLKEMGITVLGHRKKILANPPGAAASPEAPVSAENTQSSAPTSSAPTSGEAGEEGESVAPDESGETGITLRSPLGDGIIAQVDEMDDKATYTPKTQINLHPAFGRLAAETFNVFNSMLSLRVLTRPGGYVFIGLDLEIHVKSWFHIRNQDLNVRVNDQLLRLSQKGCNSRVHKGDHLYEYGLYPLTLDQLNTLLGGGDLKIRVAGSSSYHDVVIGSDALNTWRWFYQSLFDENSYATAVSAIRESVLAEERRQEEEARKRQEQIDKVKGFFTDGAKSLGNMLGGGGSKGGGGLGGLMGGLGGLMGGGDAPAPEKKEPSLADKLKALAAKKEAGEITEEEFTAAKAKLLS
jgi:hypothetical protein